MMTTNSQETSKTAMYEVVFFDGEIQGIPFTCPLFSSNYFEEKKALGLPCALLKKHEGEKNGSTAIAKHRYEDLLQAFDRQVSGNK